MNELKAEKYLYMPGVIAMFRYTKDIFAGTPYEAGDYTYGQPKIGDFGEGAKLKIGKFCSIADGTVIYIGGNHRVDWVTTYPFPVIHDDWPEAKHITGHPATKGDVIIGNDVWIAYGVIILSGVTIGDGAVVGAGSVITRNVEPYSIVAGNPAKFIKKRFDEETIEKLLQTKWWDWPEEKIRENIEILCSNNLDYLMNKIGILGD